MAYAICQYSSGFAGEVVSNESAVVENVSFLFRSLYTSVWSSPIPTGFTYRNVHGFAQFPGDSTALVYISTSVAFTVNKDVCDWQVRVITRKERCILMPKRDRLNSSQVCIKIKVLRRTVITTTQSMLPASQCWRSRLKAPPATMMTISDWCMPPATSRDFSLPGNYPHA